MPVHGCPNAENEETDVVVGLPELHEHSTDLEEAGIFYEKLMQGLVSVDQVCRSEAITRIGNGLQTNKASMKSSRTATLLMQYMDMVDILRKFIQAERTGNWDLHLQVVSEMLPYLAASGHNNYTKSALIYLQRMSRLQDEHPEVYQHFQAGLYVVRKAIVTGLVFLQTLLLSKY